MSNNQKTFSIDLPVNDKEAMDNFSDAMIEYQKELVEYEKTLAQELGVSFDCACCIVYLRSRSRHTQELENRLIDLDKRGEGMPNMCEWPPE